MSRKSVKTGRHFITLDNLPTDPKPMTDISGIELEERTCKKCKKNAFKAMKTSTQKICSSLCIGFVTNEKFWRSSQEQEKFDHAVESLDDHDDLAEFRG